MSNFFFLSVSGSMSTDFARKLSPGCGRGTIFMCIRGVEGDIQDADEISIGLEHSGKPIVFPLTGTKDGLFLEVVYKGIFSQEPVTISATKKSKTLGEAKIPLWVFAKQHPSGYRVPFDASLGNAKVGKFLISFLASESSGIPPDPHLHKADEIRIVTERSTYAPGEIVKGMFSITVTSRSKKVDHAEVELVGTTALNVEGERTDFPILQSTAVLLDHTEELSGPDIHRWRFSFSLPEKLPRTAGWSSGPYCVEYGLQARVKFHRESLFGGASESIVWCPLDIVVANGPVRSPITTTTASSTRGQLRAAISCPKAAQVTTIGETVDFDVDVFSSTKRKVKFDVRFELEVISYVETLSFSAFTPKKSNERRVFPSTREDQFDCALQGESKWTIHQPIRIAKPTMSFAPSQLDTLASGSLTSAQDGKWHAVGKTMWQMKVTITEHPVPGAGGSTIEMEALIPLTVAPSMENAQGIALPTGSPHVFLDHDLKRQGDHKATNENPQLHFFRLPSAELVRPDNAYAIDAGIVLCASHSLMSPKPASGIQPMFVVLDK